MLVLHEKVLEESFMHSSFVLGSETDLKNHAFMSGLLSSEIDVPPKNALVNRVFGSSQVISTESKSSHFVQVSHLLQFKLHHFLQVQVIFTPNPNQVTNNSL